MHCFEITITMMRYEHYRTLKSLHILSAPVAKMFANAQFTGSSVLMDTWHAAIQSTTEYALHAQFSWRLCSHLLS